MSFVEVLQAVYEWLPRVFVLDVLAFHLLADHPIEARTWVGRTRRGRRTLTDARTRARRSGPEEQHLA